MGEAWSGNLRYTGKSSDVVVEGKKSDPDAPSDPYEPDVFGCEFVERVGTKTTGTITASCDTANDSLIIDGTWTDASGKNELPFFLGPVGRFGAFDTYYRALLRTPRNVHACAPYVRVDASAPTWGDRELVSYVLRWPCEEKEDPAAPPVGLPFMRGRPGSPHPLPGSAFGQSAPAPVTGRAFLALLDPKLPDMLLAAPLPFGPVGSDVSFSIYAMSHDIDNVLLYKLSAEELSEPGPMAARGGWSRTEERNWILPVDTRGRLGTLLVLPKTYATTGLLCHNESASLDFWLVDLDGKAPDELVVRLQQNEQHDDIVPKGKSKDTQVICVDVPKVSIFAYRLDIEQVRFVSIPAPSAKALESRPKTFLQTTSHSR
jgi:hypothetical protein